MRKTTIIAIAGLVVGLALVLGPLSTASAQQTWPPGQGPNGRPGMGPMHGHGPFGPMGPGLSQRVDFGARFMQEMIPHHEDAVVMADLALAQAEHQEVRDLAATIKRVQTEEIEQMRQWYREWYGTDVPPGMMGQGPMHPDPRSIDGAQPFDKAFIEAMVPHHQMAVMMSSHMLQGVQQPELRALLESIITSQTAEIEQMTAWYREWYGAELPTFQPGPRGPMMQPGAGPRWGPGAGQRPGTGPGQGQGPGYGPGPRFTQCPMFGQ